MFRNYRIKNFNFRLVIFVIALTIIGILVIGSASEVYQRRQLVGLVLGLIVMVAAALANYEFILRYFPIYYVLVLVILAAVLFLGDDSLGATRWIDLGVLRFQPSELAKILLILFFSAFFSRYQEEINKKRYLLFTAVLAAIPLFLIMGEPDLSTTIVTFLMIAAMVFYSGISYKLVVGCLAVAVPTISILIFRVMQGGATFLEGYQGRRILAWLKPDEYPQEAYQQQNSIMAIGSGQMMGKGLYNTGVDSVKNGNYISEGQTDFIFAIAGEELGFVGSVLIILLLFAIAIECLRTARRAKGFAGQLICIGMGALVGFQGFVNICVVTGLFPNTGLPLPFVSYGLTSLVTLFLGIGIVLNVSLQAKKY